MSESDPKQPPEPGDAGGSGSVEVQVSNAPEAVPTDDSAPISSGRVQAVDPTEASEHRRSRRVSEMLQDKVTGGVEKLGTGMTSLGEGVTKLGDITKKVPLVGAAATALGESLTKAGETISIFPAVTQTRRGRLLVRSVIVGLLLVAAWIAVIVGWQVRSNATPDFRPEAEYILREISKGPDAVAKLYDEASPRFLEITKSKERFIDDMKDLDATLGKFREVTAINEVLVTTGPTGKIGRVSLTAAYERGNCKGSISLHWDDGKWKLLGIGIEVPPELKVTQAEREQRVAACLDEKGHDISRDLSPQARKKCPVRDAAETILEQIRAGNAGGVWDRAGDIFRKQESRAAFEQIQEDHRSALGDYKRLLNVTEAKAIGGISASYDVLAEFTKSSGVRVVFGFERDSKSSPWLLRSFKVVVPMPRAEEEAAAAPGSGSAAKPAKKP